MAMSSPSLRRAWEARLRAGAISPEAYAELSAATGWTPAVGDWRRFGEGLLLAAGAMLLLAGIVFFFAFNWHVLPRLYKVGLAEILWVGGLGLALWLDWGRASGRWALFAGCTLSGVCLAVVGQVYQTGADPWQLFAAWAVLILPWAVLARFPALWALVLVLANAALVLLLLHESSRRFWTFLDADFWALNLPLTFLNGAALLAWEGWRRSYRAWPERIMPRLLSTALCGLVSWPVWRAVLDDDFPLNEKLLAGVIYVLWGGASWLYYRERCRDLSMLALVLFSAEGIVLVLVGKTLSDWEHGDIWAAFWLIVLLSLAATALVVHYLRRRQLHWASLPAQEDEA